MKRFVFAFVCVALLSVPNLAQQPDPNRNKPKQGQPGQTKDKTKQDQTMQSDKKTTQGALNGGDRDFVMKAAMGGMAEVKLGEMASQRASNDEVKQFAQRMVTDHGKANNELKDLAARKNVTLPTEIDAKHKATHDRLIKLSGADFDREYMREMVKDHDKDVAMFEKASQSSRDADLKNWAAQTLPTLREHQKMARDIASKVGATMADTGKPGK